MWLDTVLVLSQILVNLEQSQQVRDVFYRLENQATLSNRQANISPECGGRQGMEVPKSDQKVPICVCQHQETGRYNT